MSLMNTASAVVVTIIPSTPTELQQPFQLGSGGILATTNDPVVQAILHILSVAFTQPTERVMQPTLGAGVQAMLFSNAPLAVFNEVAANMQTTFSNLETTSFVTNVSVTQSPTNSSTWIFAVEFVLDQDSAVHSALFDYSGTLVATN